MSLFGSLAPANASWGFSGWPVGPVVSPSLMHCSDWALLPSQSTVATGEISQRRLVIQRTEQADKECQCYLVLYHVEL